MDIIYFASNGNCYAHDEITNSLFQIGFDKKVTPFFHNSSTNGLASKQLKKNRDEDCLFALSGPNSISVFKIKETMPEELITISGIKGTIITDYVPIRDDKVLAVSDNGYLSMIRFSKESKKLLDQLRFPIELGREQVVSIAKCPEERTIIASCSYLRQSNCSKILLVRINEEDFKLSLLYQRDFSFQDEYLQPNTLFSHLALPIYYEKCLLLACFQLGNKKKMSLFLVFEDRIKEIYNFCDFNYGYSFGNKIANGRIWTVDLNGTLTYVPIYKE